LDSSWWNRSTNSFRSDRSRGEPAWTNFCIEKPVRVAIAGEIELDQPPSPGGYIRIPEGQRMRILGVIPVERIEEIVGSRPSHGIILVAPIA
jgi:hypothetical protein